MPRNSSGIYTLPGGNPVTPGTVIEASWANTTMEDLGDALTNSLSRTGAGGMLAPFRIADGSISAPGLSYLNETNTGLYRSGSGSVWMAVLGVNVAQFSTVGLTLPSGKSFTNQGSTFLTGTLAVTGATTMASTLAVVGAITATGGVIGNVTGNVTSSGTSNFAEVVISGSLDMTAGSAATITGLSTPVNASDAANKGYVDTQAALKLSLTGGTMTGAIAMSNTKITGLATPTADQDAATKAYVDSVAQGLDAKASCRASTTANITLSGAQTIDGVAVIAGDRVLVQNQSSAAQNGIYVASASTWARSSDASTWDSLVSAFTFIESGTVNGNNGYICTIAPGGTLGTTPVTWAQFSGAGQITAGTGMSKTGNTLDVNTASASRIVVGANDIDLATTGVTASTYKSVTVDAYGRVTAGTNPTTLAGYGISDAYTTAQVDAALALKLNLTGGTMSGVIAMGANKITGVADPTVAQDAATKNYIDTIFGSTTSAAASASAAASSASAAATSASNAATSATASASSATSSAASYTTFNNQYLGSKSSNPTVNNTGGALVTGNLYWNSVSNEMRVYSGSAWIAAYLPSSTYLALSGGTMTGAITFAGAQTWPTFNQNTSGTAAGLSATLVTTSGGTGLSSYTAGDLSYYASGTALSKLAIGAANRVLTSTGSAPQWVDTLTGLASVSSTSFTENTFAVVSQADIGSAPNEIPLNQYLGSLAYQNGDAYYNTGMTVGFRNRIINGAMVIDQRNAGASGTANGYTVDRWQYYGAVASKGTWQQNAGSVTPPTGYTNYLGFTSSSAYTVAASENFQIYQFIEGYNSADLGFGAAGASSVTLSFWVRSSLTGTFGGALLNGAANRSYPFTYSISSANTWEQKSITIFGETSGTWLKTTGVGIQVNFGLGVGSTYSGTAGAWASALYVSATGATSVVGTNGATWYVTGVQLEKGSTATSFDVRDYGRELIMCQRYYQQNTVPTAGLYGNTMGQVYAGTNIQSGLQLSTPMRATPSASIIGTLTWIGGALGNATVNLSSFGTIYYTPLTTLIGIAGTVASSQTGGYNWTLSSSAGGGYSLSAEL